jgi:hypothetical protein
MIRQSIPETARWADTTYHNNPVEVEKMVKRLDLGHAMILSSFKVYSDRNL